MKMLTASIQKLLPVVFGALTLAIQAQEPLPPPPDGDPEPPPPFTVVVPADRQVAGCTSTGAAVAYPEPTVVSGCAYGTLVRCTPPSGSFFPVGETSVECAINTDCGDRTNVSFKVVVTLDTSAPVLECPTNAVAYATSPDGAVVDYPLPEVKDDAGASPQLVCDPAPGSTFAPGTNRVVCTATDMCGRETTCAFTVEVRRAVLQLRRTTIAGGPTGRKPAVETVAVGFEGLDVTTSLDEEWQPLAGSMALDDLELAAAKFYRPPLFGGFGGYKAGPPAEVAYVAVGLLAAYNNPGLNPARISEDGSKNFGTELLAGDDGGGANNVWSGEKSLPFTFYFYGRPYKKFRVSKNGLLTFSTNIVTGAEGLGYFSFPQSQITNNLGNPLPLWDDGFAVDDTIFAMAGRYVNQTANDDVYGYLHGTAPYRQVWVIFRHPKDFYGRTTTGIVLEETSNRILLMDMDTDTPGITTNRLVAGIQGRMGNPREVCQVPATPAVRLVASNGGLADNGCYLLRPFNFGHQVTGKAAPEIEAATNLDLYISEQIRAINAPGVTVAVSLNGRLIFNKGYGWANVEKSEKMQPHHRACIGSVSKVLAAIGVEELIDQGAIPSLNSWAYAPGRLGKSWFWAGVNQGVTNNIHANFGTFTFLNNLTNTTIRHLLSHTGSFSNRNDDMGAARAYANSNYTELTAQDQVRWFMATNPQITNGVGLVARYSNPTFKQVGVLIEEVAGQPFEPWMLANVMNPAGVHHARLMRTFENEETWRDARRYSHYSSGSPWTTSRISGVFGPPPYGDAIYNNAADGAAGSWTATAADLVRLMAAMDHLPNRADILSTGRINEFDARAFPAMAGDQGVGWDNVSLNSQLVEKNGNIGYGSAFLRRATTPDRLTVAVVCNSGAGPDNIARAVYNAIRALPPVNPNYDLFGLQLSQ